MYWKHIIYFQEVNIENLINLVKKFASIVKNVVESIKKGVDAFKGLVGSDHSLKEIVDDFIEVFEELPEKVSSMCLGKTSYLSGLLCSRSCNKIAA